LVFFISFFYSFFNNFHPSKYKSFKTDFFFENNGKSLNVKNEFEDQLDFVIALKKKEQSKKLASFFYKFKFGFKLGAKYENLSKSFLSLSSGTCLNNFEKKNKVDYFSVDPVLERHGTYFQVIIGKIIGFISEVFIFILSIPGKIFTFFTEQIPYKAIALYLWWLIKGVFNFSHFDNYIYGPKRVRRGRIEKSYFIELHYLNKELRSHIDRSRFTDTWRLETEITYPGLTLQHTYEYRFSPNRVRYSRVLYKLHPYYFGGDEKLGVDCLLRTPPAHETRIWNNNLFFDCGKKRGKFMIFKVPNWLERANGIKLTYTTKYVTRKVAVIHKIRTDDWLNRIRLNRRIEKLRLKSKN